MIRRPPRSTQGVSSAASDVYKRQILYKRSRKTLCDRLCFYILLFFQIVVGKYIPYLLGSNPSIDLPADHDHRSQSASTDTA